MSAPLTLVVFAVGPAVFGVDAARVREVLWLPQLAVAEEAPAPVVGMFSLRGTVVPVLDLRMRLGRPPTPYGVTANVVVVETARGLIGILADHVRGVLPATIVPDAHEARHEVVSAEASAGDALVMVLDAEALWPSGEQAGTPRAVPADVLPEAQAEPLLRERADAYAQSDDRGLPAARTDIVVVLLGDERFGLPLDAIREFAPTGSLTRIPCCPPHVLGTRSLRGELVTVMDIRAALGLPAEHPRSLAELVVCEADEQLLGLAVREVVDVLTIDPASVFPSPASRGGHAFVTGEVMVEPGIITLIDLAALLADGGLEVNEVMEAW